MTYYVSSGTLNPTHSDQFSDFAKFLRTVREILKCMENCCSYELYLLYQLTVVTEQF